MVVETKYSHHAHLDELIELLDVLQFGVAVEQQRRVVLVRAAFLVQSLQVPREVVNALGVQELADDCTAPHSDIASKTHDKYSIGRAARSKVC